MTRRRHLTLVDRERRGARNTAIFVLSIACSCGAVATDTPRLVPIAAALLALPAALWVLGL